jgi:hypothetical protein
MKETNPLEAQLRSWTPRRPSAELERKLFGRKSTLPVTAGMVFWFGPVTACLLFVCVVLSQHSTSSFSPASRPDAMVAAIMSNQSYAAFLPGSFQRSANRLDTFEWTNKGRFTSFMGSLPSGRTND